MQVDYQAEADVEDAASQEAQAPVAHEMEVRISDAPNGEAKPTGKDDELSQYAAELAQFKKSDPLLSLHQSGELTTEQLEAELAGEGAAAADSGQGGLVKQKPLRFRPRNEEEARMIDLMRNNPDMELGEVLTRAGIDVGQLSHQQLQDYGTYSPALQELEAQIAEANLKMEDAIDDEDPDYIREVKQELDALNTELVEARVATEMATNEALQRVDAEFNDSYQRASDRYPALQDPDNALTQRARQVFDAWAEIGDPRIYSGDAPELIADLVAHELGVQPARETTDPNGYYGQDDSVTYYPDPSQTHSASSGRRQTGRNRAVAAPPPVLPASGNARTNQANRSSTFQQTLANTNTPEDYESLKKQLGFAG